MQSALTIVPPCIAGTTWYDHTDAIPCHGRGTDTGTDVGWAGRWVLLYPKLVQGKERRRAVCRNMNYMQYVSPLKSTAGPQTTADAARRAAEELCPVLRKHENRQHPTYYMC